MGAIGYAKDQPQGFTNRIEKVAIVGAAGKIGSHLTAALLQTGRHAITAIARPDSTSNFPPGVTVSHVDYNGSPEPSAELIDALRGHQVLLITMSVAAPRDTVSKLIRAAAAAHVPYVLPNWFGQDPQHEPLCRDTLLAGMRDNLVDEFARLGGTTKYLLLACNFWYEFSLGGGPNRYGFDFPRRELVLFDGGDTPINTTTWPQCGRAVAQLLSLKELPDDEHDKAPTLAQFANGPVYVSSFRLSQKEMFESVKRVTKTTDADWKIKHESSELRWKETLAGVQKGDWSVFTKMLYSRTWFRDGGGDYESQRGTDNKVLGLPVEDLDEATAEGIRMGENGEVPFGH